MIQPVSASTSQAKFRGSTKINPKTDLMAAPSSKIAIANAAGTAVAAGGITAAISRAYTSSWGHAGVLGLFGAFLTMFFMTPHLIDNLSSLKPAAKSKTDILVKDDAHKVADVVKEHLKPNRRMIPFRQWQA